MYSSNNVLWLNSTFGCANLRKKQLLWCKKCFLISTIKLWHLAFQNGSQEVTLIAANRRRPKTVITEVNTNTKVAILKDRHLSTSKLARLLNIPKYSIHRIVKNELYMRRVLFHSSVTFSYAWENESSLSVRESKSCEYSGFGLFEADNHGGWDLASPLWSKIQTGKCGMAASRRTEARKGYTAKVGGQGASYCVFRLVGDGAPVRIPPKRSRSMPNTIGKSCNACCTTCGRSGQICTGIGSYTKILLVQIPLSCSPHSLRSTISRLWSTHPIVPIWLPAIFGCFQPSRRHCGDGSLNRIVNSWLPFRQLNSSDLAELEITFNEKWVPRKTLFWKRSN